MPTYDYRCQTCGEVKSVMQTIREYSQEPKIPECHGKMERYLSVMPGFSGIANALAGDRHYDGLVAPDGTDISSRTKHREYMKSRGITTADDFTDTWRRADQERQALRTGTFEDSHLTQTITEAVMKEVAKPD